MISYFFSVTENFSTFSKDLLTSFSYDFILHYDEIYLVFSAFTSRSISLLAVNTAVLFSWY
jgi:hypothetical protein